MAVAAADVLIRRLGGDQGPARTQVFPTELVLRATHLRAAATGLTDASAYVYIDGRRQRRPLAPLTREAS